MAGNKFRNPREEKKPEEKKEEELKRYTTKFTSCFNKRL